jgi:SAM-dependent methyltransferase
MHLYVQYGCGMSAPSSWKNYDASPTLRFERIPFLGRLYTKNASRFPENVEYGDIVKGLPLPENSCAGIYASHVLEHLALNDFRVALRNSFTLLRPGGIFRLIVPDLEVLARRYVESDDPEACETFMRATSLGKEVRPRRVTGFIKSFFANNEHLWMWDFKSLKRELSTVGFVEIRRCAPGDSEDPNFKHVEDPERFIDAVAIECKRPNADAAAAGS